MAEFDYKRAWKVLAKPSFDALPAEVRSLFLQVVKDAQDLNQDRETLDMPWPDESVSDLRAKFKAIPAPVLSDAAHTIFAYGHWASDEHSGLSRMGNGAYWKFANYADQVLSERLGLKRDRKAQKGYGTFLSVQEGVIRGQFATSYMSTWVEIGPATKLTFDAIKAAKFPEWPTDTRPTHYPHLMRKFENEVQEVLRNLRTECGAWLLHWDTAEFMVEKLPYRW